MFAFASPKGFEGHSSAAPMMAWQDSHGIAGLSSLGASPLATPRRPVGVDAVPATQEPSSTPANATSRMSFDSQGGGGKASSASRMSFDNDRDDGVSSPPFRSVPRSGGGGAGSRWSPYGFAEPAELGPGGASMSTRLKRPRSSSHLSDDDVQPTRLFGASPGTKRALSEMMAKDLQRLNVSPAAAAGAGERDLRVRERNSFDGGAAASASAWATTQPHAVTPRASWEGIDADASPWASSFGVVSPGAAAAADGRLTTWNDASPMSTEKGRVRRRERRGRRARERRERDVRGRVLAVASLEAGAPGVDRAKEIGAVAAVTRSVVFARGTAAGDGGVFAWFFRRRRRGEPRRRRRRRAGVLAAVAVRGGIPAVGFEEAGDLEARVLGRARDADDATRRLG